MVALVVCIECIICALFIWYLATPIRFRIMSKITRHVTQMLPSKYTQPVATAGIIHSMSTSNTSTGCFWSHKLISELRRLCLLYIGIVIDTSILTHDEQSQLYELLLSQRSSFVSTSEPKYNVLNLLLLYRATNTTFDKNIFYQQCSKRKNILFLLRNNFGNVIGGFISVGIFNIEQPREWSMDRLYYFLFCFFRNGETFVRDPNLFLLRIRSCRSLPSRAYPLQAHAYADSIRHLHGGSVWLNSLGIIQLSASLHIYNNLEADMVHLPPRLKHKDPFDVNGEDFVGDYHHHDTLFIPFQVHELEIFEIFSL
eukprot:758283_1